MRLYYNCHYPLKVLDAGVIQVSKIHRGVSMSGNFNMGSHGPFKLVFQDPVWLPRMRRCLYMTTRHLAQKPHEGSKDRIRLAGPVIGYRDQDGKEWSMNEYYSLFAARIAKNAMFADEQEYWSPTEVRFGFEEVVKICYMTNAPVLYPRVALKTRAELRLRYPKLYEEIRINDPYLEKSA